MAARKKHHKKTVKKTTRRRKTHKKTAGTAKTQIASVIKTLQRIKKHV